MSQNPGIDYNYPLGKVTITASQVGTRINVSMGGSFQQNAWVEVSNESPYILSIFTAQGILLNQLQPQICDIAQIPSGDSFFSIIPSLLIPQAAPSSEVDINVYPFGKPSGAYPFPLNRQSAPTAGTSGFGYSVIFFQSSVTEIELNIFNPLTSTKIGTVYWCTIFDNSDGNNDLLSIGLQAAADFNQGTPLSARPNDTNAPTSVMHITGGNALHAFVTHNQIQPANPKNLYTLVLFPDQIIIRPGVNCVGRISAGVNTTAGTIVIMWTEQ